MAIGFHSFLPIVSICAVQPKVLRFVSQAVSLGRGRMP